MSVPESLYQIAPPVLPNMRPSRFDGGGFGADLNSFAAPDQARLARIYAAVNGVGAVSLRSDPVLLRERLTALDTQALIRDASELGSDTAGAVVDETRMRQLLHDVRGGGLQVLVGAAELIRYDPGAAAFAKNAVSAARDHAKIMRAGFPALDPVTYAHDESAKVHAVDGIVTTWNGLTMLQNGRTVRVSVDCEYRGAITGRCLETAAIDRIVCNYVNNAVRFAADGRVSVWVFRAGPELVRWAVHNAVTADDRAWLDQKTGGDLRKLFQGGTTRGGNGVGLSGCAEIVGECFGVGPKRAVQGGYLGARADAGGYTAWFHWPAHASGDVTCACDD